MRVLAGEFYSSTSSLKVIRKVNSLVFDKVKKPWDNIVPDFGNIAGKIDNDKTKERTDFLENRYPNLHLQIWILRTL